MLTEDHIIRMINLAISALLQIIGLKKAGSYLDALQLIDLTFEQLLGLRASMAKNLDDNRLYYLLTRQDRLDTQRLAIIADLFEQEGDILAALERTAESQADYCRALRYNLEVLFQSAGEATVEMMQKIDGLVQKLDLPSLGADTLWPLAGYYEEEGQYARAEGVLLLLAERPEVRDAILPEMRAFYERMAKKKSEALEKGGMSREKVKAGLARWERGS